MNHKNFEELIILYLYDELNDVDKNKLLEHLKNCKECTMYLQSQSKVHQVLNSKMNILPGEKLLNDSRNELRVRLKLLSEKKSLFQISKEYFSELFEFHKLQIAAYAALLVIGFFAGFLLKPNSPVELNSPTQQVASNNKLIKQVVDDNMAKGKDVKIENIKFIDNDPSDGDVEFEFDAVKPVRIKGNVNDSQIKDVLTYAMLNSQNAGLRLHTLNVINSKPDMLDNDVKKSLIKVIKTDENPGVRKQAIELLKKYKYDDQIKKAMIFALDHDTIPGLRIQAINYLAQLNKSGYKFSNDDVNTLKNKRNDENTYVRIQAASMLKEIK